MNENILEMFVRVVTFRRRKREVVVTLPKTDRGTAASRAQNGQLIGSGVSQFQSIGGLDDLIRMRRNFGSCTNLGLVPRTDCQANEEEGRQTSSCLRRLRLIRLLSDERVTLCGRFDYQKEGTGRL